MVTVLVSVSVSVLVLISSSVSGSILRMRAVDSRVSALGWN